VLNVVVIIGHWQQEKVEFNEERIRGVLLKSEHKLNITEIGAETEVTTEI
jgi:predicted RNA-binding protein